MVTNLLPPINTTLSRFSTLIGDKGLGFCSPHSPLLSSSLASLFISRSSAHFSAKVQGLKLFHFARVRCFHLQIIGEVLLSFSSSKIRFHKEVGISLLSPCRRPNKLILLHWAIFLHLLMLVSCLYTYELCTDFDALHFGFFGLHEFLRLCLSYLHIMPQYACYG